MSRNWLMVIAAVVLVVISSGATFFILQTGVSGSRDTYGTAVPRRFDVFEGYNRCLTTVEDNVPGRVVSIEGDDRAAKYDRSTNMNLLFFSVDYSNGSGSSGYRGGQLLKIYALCEVSAKTNRIESVKMRPANEKEFTEVVRRP